MKKHGLLFIVFCLIIASVLYATPMWAANEITVTSPNGGETWNAGSIHNITWLSYYGGGYIFLDYSTDSGASWHSINTEGIANTGSYSWTVPDIAGNHMRVRVVYWSIGNSYSDVSDADFTINLPAPAKPDNLKATATSSTEIELTWKDNSSNETGFRIFRSDVVNSDYHHINTVGSNETSYTDTGRSPGTKYFYKVSSFNNGGNSALSPEAYATTLITIPPIKIPTTPVLITPDKPSGLTAAGTSSSSIELSWSDNSTNETGFKIERSLNNNSGFTEITSVGADVTKYSDSGLSAATPYYYRIRAYNALGNSAYSNEVGVSTLAASVVPQQPQIPTVTPVTELRFYLNNADYFVNSQVQSMDTAPVMLENRTLLPVKYVAQPLGASIGWDGETRKVTITMENTIIEMWIDNNTARVNGQERLIDPNNPSVKPVIIPPGRTMLPLRFIGENLGCQVDWNQVNQEAKLSYPKPVN